MVSEGENRQGPTGSYVARAVEHVIYGPGSVTRWNQIPALADARAILATTGSVARSPLFGKLTELFAPILAATYKETRQHAPVSAVSELADRIHESGADVVISLGGGSVIDTAKAAIDRLAKPSGNFLPHIALPTTLSAAEFARSYGMTDDETRRKHRGSDERLLPAAVILDARLTLQTPDWLWLGSGLRAVDHAVETVCAPDCNPAADVFALEAIRRLFRFLPSSFPATDGVGARQECQIAAWLSFALNASVTMGTSHRLGRLIGPIYSIPHGFTSSILLPHVLDSERMRTQSRQNLVARAAAEGLTEAKDRVGGDAAELIRGLVQRLQLPSRLREVGIPRDDLHALAEGSDTDLGILEAAW